MPASMFFRETNNSGEKVLYPIALQRATPTLLGLFLDGPFSS